MQGGFYRHAHHSLPQRMSREEYMLSGRAQINKNSNDSLNKNGLWLTQISNAPHVIGTLKDQKEC